MMTDVEMKMIEGTMKMIDEETTEIRGEAVMNGDMTIDVLIMTDGTTGNTMIADHSMTGMRTEGGHHRTSRGETFAILEVIPAETLARSLDPLTQGETQGRTLVPLSICEGLGENRGMNQR